MAFIEPTTLAARGLKLVPLTLDHEMGLRAAAADGELWKLRITSVPAPDATRAYIDTALKSREEGHRFAFDALSCNVVGWRTDNFNTASQRAIERLGAKKDGVIRGNALRRDGTIRDTVMYSLSRGEWPEVRAHLNDLLSRHRD